MFDKFKSISQSLTPGTRKVIRNVGWLFVEKVLTMAISFAVGVFVIRYLGSENFGKLSYGISFVTLFGSVATLGLTKITVRNIVREETASNEILGTVVLLRTLGAVLTMIVIIIAAFRLESDAQIRLIIVILSSQLLFTTVDNTIELWFQSQVLAGKATIIKVAQVIANSSVRLVLIRQKLSLIAFAWTMLAASAFKAVGMIWIYTRQGKSVRDWKFNATRGKAMLSDSWPLIFSTLTTTPYMKIDQIMLDKITRIIAVDNFSASVTSS